MSGGTVETQWRHSVGEVFGCKIKTFFWIVANFVVYRSSFSNVSDRPQFKEKFIKQLIYIYI